MALQTDIVAREHGTNKAQPVTLTLRKGDPNDLETVDILADGVEGNSYEWKVDTDLDSGTYVIQAPSQAPKLTA